MQIFDIVVGISTIIGALAAVYSATTTAVNAQS